ncbi:tannase and feruloyl esterase [Aaosphaeria arxii CBS 175.79]|uniref:Carboxylic ester hydrolase n=1 Tax=Aaosphaeria arxii CBS 175.79 TaxID=1450172 RepID=A0A6A5XDL8_9PLEO|nr:tannase and feruloyl esterase [Aaosphaeria arxii CBS 175.79]KAF2011108.1 tannase and feruloyl esterase [Aaosphaeria arxii CBS 175.79]
MSKFISCSTILLSLAASALADDSLQRMNAALADVFKGVTNTTILHVQHFVTGDFLLPVSPPNGAVPVVPRASNGATVVKLFIRTTGNAPATPNATAGTDVGIELWFPEVDAWTGRIVNFVHGGWQGYAGVTATNFSSPQIDTSISEYSEWASSNGYVSAISDGGHVAKDLLDTSYLVTANNEPNYEGWKNQAWQSAHLMAETSKSIAKAYYGREQNKTYLQGCSTGGRAAYQMAQQFPADYDGIVAISPSITGSRLYESIGNPTLILNNDKHEPFTTTQLSILGQKAIAAGDTSITGQHDGYITDWQNNTYDATKDPTILRVEDGGNCTEPWAITLAQANAINKIWYGITRDGQIPSPSQDNGYGLNLNSHKLYWGPMRGSQLTFANTPFAIVGNWWASVFRDASLGDPDYFPGGTNAWQNFTYEQFAEKMLEGQRLDHEWINMDADNPDLSAFHDQGGKIMVYHGLADPNVPPHATISYYERSSAISGGYERAREFHRLFLVPGMGHCAPVSGQYGDANVPFVGGDDLVEEVARWVEDGKGPDSVLATSSDGKVSRPVCVYPGLPRYDREGDVGSASSFSC